MAGIRGRPKILVALMMIFTLIFMSFPSMADNPHDFSGTFQVFAGQNEPIGTVNVHVDQGLLTLQVTMYPGWPAEEYSLYLLEAPPTERPNPGHAPIKSEHLNSATDFTIGPLSLDLPDLAPGQCLTRYLVLHLVSGNETAYPGIIIKPDQGSWFGYMPITICEPEGPPTGTLILRKLVVNHRGQTPESNPAENEPAFNIPTHFAVHLRYPDGTLQTLSLPGNGDPVTLTQLPLGTYTLSEDPPPGFTLQSIQTQNVTVPNDLEITLSERDPCHEVTVTNRSDDPNPPAWSLTLIKKVTDRQGHPLTEDPATFSIKIEGLEPLDYENTVQITNGAAATVIPLQEPGYYRLSELASDGYILKSMTHDGTLLTDGVIALSESNRDLPIEITVTNEKEDSPPPTTALRLIKTVVDENNRLLASHPGTFAITLKDPDGNTKTVNLKGDGTPVTLDHLKPGLYTISEAPPAGYTLERIQSGEMTSATSLQITLSESDAEHAATVILTNKRQPEPPPGPPPGPSEPFGEIRVHKFLDTNQNAQQESTEFNMQNITFELYAANKTTLISTKTTDSEGNLAFTGLRYGTYYLREISPYTITTPGFSADGFSAQPITINSTQALSFNIGNFRETTTTEDVPPQAPPLSPPDETDEPPETEIVEEEPPPLGAPPWEPPPELPQTGELPAYAWNLLGTLLLLAGVFLKFQS